MRNSAIIPLIDRGIMIYVWMLIALALTVVGSLLILQLDQAEHQHDEEIQYEERIGEQVASLTVAKCEADPNCRHEHRKSMKRLKRHRRAHEKQFHGGKKKKIV